MKSIQYDDFVIHIGKALKKRSGRRAPEYPVAVVQSPAGIGQGILRVPFTQTAIEEGLTTLEQVIRPGQRPVAGELKEALVAGIGEEIYLGLFTGEVRDRFDASLRHALDAGRGLRIKLNIEPFELARLPWEFMFHADYTSFLVLSVRTPIVRYTPVTGPAWPRLELDPPLRLLAVIASPVGYPLLDAEREKRRINTALRDSRRQGRLTVSVLERPTVAALQSALRQQRAHILHFIGHGGYSDNRGGGFLVLENETGKPHLISAKALSTLFGDAPHLRLVVLNACETGRLYPKGGIAQQGSATGMAMALAETGVPAVVAMQFPISDDAATVFSREFYGALADGYPVDAAVTEGRKAIYSTFSEEESMEWGTPVLYMQVPDGMLFASGPAPATPPAPASAPPLLPDDVAAPALLFRTRGPLDPERDAAICADRSEVDDALHLIRQPNVANYLSILSARQTGKTTLLFQIRSRLQQSSFATAFVDLSVLEGHSEAAVYRFVAGQILGELRREIDLEPEAIQSLAQVNTAMELRGFFVTLAQRARLPRLVILLDEAGAVPASMTDAFFGMIRNLFSSRGKESERELQKYVFVFAGASDLHRLTTGDNSPLNICEKLYLSDLPRSGVAHLLRNFERIGIEVEIDTVDYLMRQTGGHPYLVQRVCSLLEGRGDRTITPKVVQAAISELLRDDDNLDHLCKQLDRSPDARDFLRRLVVDGERLRFSRINSLVARLELIGAIKEVGGACAVRNRIYERALQAYYGVA